jgi:alpha-tubulin suppressor-like RCC1 family protein
MVLPPSQVARSIFAGGNFTAIITNSNRLYTCGNNFNGQLGYNTNASTNSPNASLAEVTITGQTIASLSCGRNFLGVLTSVGLLYTCGDNTYGQLGYPTSSTTLNTTLNKVTIPFDGTSVVTDIVQDFSFPTNTTCTAQRVPNTGQYYDPCYFYF